MRVFGHHSARARCRHFQPQGVGCITYSGLVGQAALETLEPLAMGELGRAQALIIRLDGCVLIAPNGALMTGLESGRDACVLVRPEQYDVYAEYALHMADQGVKRVVFLNSQAHLAQEWIDRRVAAALRAPVLAK